MGGRRTWQGLRTCSLGKRVMSAGAHCAAMRRSSACTNSLHCSAGCSRRQMALRTSSSKGASGISSDPRTPPLFFIAVRTSSSLSSLRPELLHHPHALHRCSRSIVLG